MFHDACDDFVTFYLNQQMFGVDLRPISEVLAMPEFRILGDPTHPEVGAARGIFNLRGAIVPVVDLKVQLGLPTSPYGLSHKVIVVHHNESLFGLVVDSLGTLVNLEREQLSPAPIVNCGIPRRFVKHVGRTSEGLIVILNIEEVLDAVRGSFALVEDVRETIAS